MLTCLERHCGLLPGSAASGFCFLGGPSVSTVASPSPHPVTRRREMLFQALACLEAARLASRQSRHLLTLHAPSRTAPRRQRARRDSMTI